MRFIFSKKVVKPSTSLVSDRFAKDEENNCGGNLCIVSYHLDEDPLEQIWHFVNALLVLEVNVLCIENYGLVGDSDCVEYYLVKGSQSCLDNEH